jgi:hypothetical protein
MRKLIDKRIGEILVELGVLKEGQVQSALALQKQRETKVLMGDLLIESQFATEEDIIRGLKTQYQFTYFPVSRYSIDRDLIDAFPYETALKHSVIPVNKLGNILTIAMTNPLNKEAVQEIEEATQCTVRCLISAPSEIKTAIMEYYTKAEAALPPEELDSDFTFESLTHAGETSAEAEDPELFLKKYDALKKEYQHFLSEARKLIPHAYYYSCIAMCCLSAEHVLKNILRSSVLGKRSYLTVDSEEDQTIDAMPPVLIAKFLKEYEMIDEAALGDFEDLVKLKKKYFQTYAMPTERTAHLAVELLENVIKATQEKSRA